MANFYLDTNTKLKANGLAKTRSRGHNATALNLRNRPCGDKIGEIKWNREVNLTNTEDIRSATCFGRSWDWREVEVGGKGWVADFYLDVMGG